MSERITAGSLYQATLTPARPKSAPEHPARVSSFDSLLQKQMVKFSHHAEERLRQRGIEFKPEQLAKINTAIDKAATKGAKDSLMLINDTALIVNIKNRTIVTAMDGASMKDNVFTQIDSAMIIS
ncbi:flagellar operon protein [Paenibacillus sp. UNCCL117]|uniref:TIGR02530 family flagellar biosynthesis protein n=1 Tax=unclassified Paenibacillus TaxID=185978 RepID=UPI0008863E92|nr:MULTISPECIES: TIGR02530 family flagellar biosynthesis protein [unclassified Paenibacillus]SDC86335.1 flagellar operon protein [Paenibacillus sp. cl123]SFW27784.1 flagellar operon protein [Paenibacillus sp. UNCCL117]